MDALCTLLSLVALAAVSITTSVAAAQTTSVAIASEGWTIFAIEHPSGFVDPRAARSGRIRLPLGDVTFGLGEPDAFGVQHRRTVSISPGRSLRFGRRSRGSERTAGNWVAGTGLVAGLTFLLTGLGLSQGGSHPLAEGNQEAAGPVLAIGGGVLALTLAIGLPLAAWRDDVVVEVHRDDDGVATSTVRLGAGPGDVGVAVSLTL